MAIQRTTMVPGGGNNTAHPEQRKKTMVKVHRRQNLQRVHGRKGILDRKTSKKRIRKQGGKALGVEQKLGCARGM